MKKAVRATLESPSTPSRDVLTEIVRRGAQEMLATAIGADVSEWIQAHEQATDNVFTYS